VLPRIDDGVGVPVLPFQMAGRHAVRAMVVVQPAPAAAGSWLSPVVCVSRPVAS
jgi:hypothetical protein